MSIYDYENYNGIELFDSEMFKQDEKHSGKDIIGRAQILYMLARTQSMFKYSNLPETIPQRNLEIMLQTNGNVFFTEVNGDYYVFTGGLGGKPDVYYEPTEYVIANPALRVSKNLDIKNDGVLIRSDSYMIGLLPMMQKYACLMVENEFTMRIADINSRIPFLLSATDDKTLKSCYLFLERIVDGELGVISDDAFYESLKVNPVSSGNNTRLTDLIEYQQYLKAAWFNELGLNANYNMKREAVSAGEAQLNDDALLPFIDDMLKCRKEGIDKVNDMYGLDISIELDSAWLKEQKEQMLVDENPEMDNNIDENFPPEDSSIQESESDNVAISDSDSPEEVPADPEEEPAEPEEITEDIIEEVKEDIEEIKEDIEEVKEELKEDSEDGDIQT